MAKSELIVFNGVKFRRYPESPRRADRVYFSPGIADRQRGAKRLHEEIWIAANGPVPDGCQIHHRDENPLNNELDNLEAIPRAEHMRHHHAGRTTPAKLAHLANVRHLAAEWHSTAEGQAFHSETAQKQWAERVPHTFTCEWCAEEVTRLALQVPRFCSNKCKSAWRRASGLDDIDKTCVVCGETYRANRYARPVTCSRSCGSKNRKDRQTRSKSP